MSVALADHGEGDMLAILRRQIETQKKQVETNEKILEEVIRVRDDVNATKKEVNNRFVVMEEMVQEVRDSVTLTDSECFDLQQLVFSRSNSLAKDRFKEEDGKFNVVVGKHRRAVWKALKNHFKVARYSHIRRVDFEDVKMFVRLYLPEDFM